MAIIRVPADYPTIAAAVAAAASGDTIQVAANYAMAETVVVSTENLSFNGSSQANVTLILSGVDTIHAGGRLPFAVVGDTDGAYIYGSLTAANSLTGGNGVDHIFAQVGDTVDAGGGNDVIFWRGGKPAHIDGGAGNDILRINGSVSFTAGSIENVEHFTIADGVNAQFDALDYAVVVQSLSTAAGNEIVRGTVFDDLFFSGAGADRFVGNAGIDTLSYVYAEAGVTAALAAPTSNTGWAAGDTYAGLENLTGSNYADTLSGDSHANVIDGRNGDDTILGGTGDTLRGGFGNDTFIVNGSAGQLAASIDGDYANIAPEDAGYDTVFVTGNTTLTTLSRITHIERFDVADGVIADFSAADGTGNGTQYVSHSVAGSGTTIKTFASPDYYQSSFIGGEGADTLIAFHYGSFILNAQPTLVDGGSGGEIWAMVDMDLSDSNVRNVQTFVAAGGVDLDLSGITYGGVRLEGSYSGGPQNFVGTAFKDAIFSSGSGGSVTGGKGADFIVASNNASDTFVFQAGDSGITAATSDILRYFQTGVDHVHLDGITPSAASYAESQIAPGAFESFDTARTMAATLMQGGDKDVVYIASRFTNNGGWLFWNTDADHTTPDQAIQFSNIPSHGFALTDLL